MGLKINKKLLAVSLVMLFIGSGFGFFMGTGTGYNFGSTDVLTGIKNNLSEQGIILAYTQASDGQYTFTVDANQLYQTGVKDGTNYALTQVTDLLTANHLDFTWTETGDGKYNLKISGLDAYGTAQALGVHGATTCDINVLQYRADGTLVSGSHGAGTLTDLGQDYLAQQTSGAVNATQCAKYISMSNNTSGLTGASTILPTEYVTADSNGLARAAGTYAYGAAGSGTWNVTNTFTATAVAAPLVWGLSYQTITNTGGIAGATITAGNNLVAYDSTPGVKNMAVSDTLAVTWTVTVS